ncbi:MAG: ABC transporter ATP-binding protein [Anaerococcus sp.]|jgi:ABC transporter related|uniref:ABC transporter ATP-binding protein n=1 Tax=Anaerococcus sp. TaxID=1872515 RepID=UPI0029143BE7|nr:ABC transporter ATP-binding protein [Anaerococcus sp.]MDU5229240.1 ABC transporter ATP-binding protein [Anaerococcus sp.]MDU7411020.1 ABC transporter ATP-binding protein [Anaerococcus sp.]
MIETKNLTMVYNGTAVLDNVNLNLEDGQLIGLVGENGSGKTTLLRILAGLERNYQGDVKINGELPGGNTNKMISYQPDHLALDENLKISQVVDMYAKFFDDFSSDKFYNLLEGFDISKELKIKECSKGMKEKVQIALTLSRKAKIYLLDEPLSGIDPKSRKTVLTAIIENFDYEGILLLSTHLIGEVERALDRVLFMDHGQLVVNESVDDIREKHHMGVEEYFTEVI